MFQAYKRYWKNYFSTRAPGTRGEVWAPFLIHFVLSLILLLVSNGLSGKAKTAMGYVCLGFSVVTFIGFCTAAVRRLKSTGRSWKYILLIPFPIPGWILLAIFTLENDDAVCARLTHSFRPDPEHCREVCERCGYARELHSYKGCKCTVCGKVRDQEHVFSRYLHDKCVDECICCGKQQPHHDWNKCTCRVCGKKRDRHDYVRTEGEGCLLTCSVCGRTKREHSFNAAGECVYCGYRDPKPFTLGSLSGKELDSVRLACEVFAGLNSVTGKMHEDYVRFKCVTGTTRLNAPEVAEILNASVQTASTISQNIGKGSVNPLFSIEHATNLISAVDKLKKLLQPRAADTQKEYIKKPLSAFPLYDESCPGYVRGGVCDVCNRPLEPGKAYAVDNQSFYDSPEYFEYLDATQKRLTGKKMTREDYEQRRRLDTSPGSAVCADCIRMFADMTGAGAEPGEKVWRESDNAGTRHDTLEKANVYWLVERPQKNAHPPFIMFRMPSRTSGEEALLELPFFHRAADTGRIITERIMIYGVYPVGDDLFEALVCGTDLSAEEYAAAQAAFKKHGGTQKGELEPEEYIAPCLASDGDKTKAVFKEHLDQPPRSYDIYTAPTKADALAFLLSQTVRKPYFYIVAETREGSIGRDINGIYEE